MVRNYNGGEPGTNYRTYYDRALLNVDGDVWRKPASWRPQLVVIGLGINDFSTAINPGEPWTAGDAWSPPTATRTTASSTSCAPGTARARSSWSAPPTCPTPRRSPRPPQQIVQERNGRGDDRVRYWYYDNAGLDHLGCHWHPSLHDHQIIADRLDDFLATLPLRW